MENLADISKPRGPPNEQKTWIHSIFKYSILDRRDAIIAIDSSVMRMELQYAV